jgi:hypothetical protein
VLVLSALTAENVTNGIERMPGGAMGQNVAFVNARRAEVQRYEDGMAQLVQLFETRR